MIPTEQDRERIAVRLGAEQDSRWKALKSEIHDFGKQTLFFFLIDNPQKIGEILAIFQRVAADDLARFDESEFELSFVEIRDGKNIVWDVVDNDEIRGTLPTRRWGAHPAQFDLGEDELFAEYIEPK
jgi:hypothetical protein